MSETDIAALIHDCMIVTMKLGFPDTRALRWLSAC